MNTIQFMYAAKKAKKEALEAYANDVEKKYIEENKIKENGKTPLHLWMLEDTEVFDYHNKRLADILNKKNYDAEYKRVSEELKSAENALIEFGLSLAPDSIRATLEKGVKENYGIRQKFLNATFNLNTKEVA